MFNFIFKFQYHYMYRLIVLRYAWFSFHFFRPPLADMMLQILIVLTPLHPVVRKKVIAWALKVKKILMFGVTYQRTIFFKISQMMSPFQNLENDSPPSRQLQLYFSGLHIFCYFGKQLARLVTMALNGYCASCSSFFTWLELPATVNTLLKWSLCSQVHCIFFENLSCLNVMTLLSLLSVRNVHHSTTWKIVQGKLEERLFQTFVLTNHSRKVENVEHHWQRKSSWAVEKNVSIRLNCIVLTVSLIRSKDC